jgi:hypothetical protein
VVFYAATPGAFSDLAADLGYALHAPTTTSDPAIPDDIGGDGAQDMRSDRQLPIVLDADLPPPTVVSGLTGLEDLSAINRAVGILIEQGHHPDRAHDTLRRHAAAAGIAPHRYAALLLLR